MKLPKFPKGVPRFSRTGVPVTERALLQRLNRKLSIDGRELRKARGAQVKVLGAFYIVSNKKHVVEKKHVDPESLARELNVLREEEYVAKDGD